MSTTTNTPAQQLFDLAQRAADGAWVVWVRKSPTELGMVSRDEIEAQRGAPFTEAEWAEFSRQPHFTEATVPVIAGVYKTRPSIDVVLAMLGVKRKQKPAKTPQVQAA